MNIDKIIQFLIVIIIFIIIIILLRQAVAEKKEKRIAYYSLEPLKDASIPLIDKIKNKYLIFVQKNRQILLKIDYFKNKSKKYLTSARPCGIILEQSARTAESTK